ncbi:MAG TPA: NlpC/P60 family protein [Jatrophihabitans sp.]|nr:NlpC/P60 family protein [Jatrophihabitans sp.]
MSVGIDSVDAVLARISQIQAGFVSAGIMPAPGGSSGAAATGSALGSAGFASTLAQVQAGGQPGSASTGSAGGSVTGSQVVASAEKYLGVPYVFGGTTSAGIDCSGLVQRAYGDLGITLPRIAADQAKVGTAVPSLAQARPGDILAFGNPAYHVAIYLGNNMMIAAPEPGEKVKIQSVYQTPDSIRRVVAPDSTGISPVESSDSHLLASSLPGLDQFTGIFAQNEARYQLPTGLLAAVAETESGGNTSAVSPAGAQGLMQLMPSTAQGLGVDPWNPGQAVQGAAQLLSGYLHRFGTVPLALAAYNAGPAAVEQYGGVPPYTETQNYVSRITGLMAGASA